MQAIIIILLVLAGLFAAYFIVFPGKVRVARSITIKRRVDEVYAHVLDFRTWRLWSPWLMQDPDTKLVYSETVTEPGGYYTWNSKVVGKGKITHSRLEVNKLIGQSLEFAKPIRSFADVTWEFEETGADSTKLTWKMKSQMPLPLRWLAGMVKRGCDADFDLGLARLNGLLDEEAGFPKITFEGVVSVPAVRALASRHENVPLDELPLVAKQAFEDLKREVAQPADMPRMVYTKFSGNKFSFDAAVPVPPDFAKPGGKYEIIDYPAGDFSQSTLTGSYDFLRHAWPAAINQLRMRKHKMDPKRPSLEIYPNDPSEVEPSQLKTLICLPVK